MSRWKIVEFEHELLCNDLEKIQSALETVDINNSDEIKRLTNLKKNILQDLEKIEWELVRKNRPRTKTFLDF